MNTPAPDFRSVFAHLCRVHRDRLFVVGALPLGGGATACATFNHTAESAFIDFAQRNLDRDLCQVLNEPSKSIDGWKGRTETAFKNVWHIVIDFDLLANIDRDSARSRIIDALTTERPANVPPPTWMEKANGIKAYWSLREPIHVGGDPSAIADAKLYGIGLEDAFKEKLRGVCKVDSCRSIDHLFRIAGIICRKPEQPDVPVVIVAGHDHIDDPVFMYAAVQLPKAAAVPQTTTNNVSPNAAANIAPARTFKDDASDIPVSPRMCAVIHSLTDPQEPGKYPAGSNSEAQFACTLAMAAAVIEGKMTRAEVEAVHRDERYALRRAIYFTSGGKKKRPSPDKYLVNQIDKALDKVRVDARQQSIEGDGWISHNGSIIASNPDNIRLALKKLGIALRYDEFADKMIATVGGGSKRLEDKHYVTWRFEVYDKFGFLPPVEVFDLVINDTAYRNSFHPVKEYLDSLKWDGTPRINKWQTIYGGADDTPLNSAIGRIWLIAGVRRIRQPGCKFDEMLTWESGQGTGKSSAAKILAVMDEWFTDYLPINAKASERIEAMKGRLVVEHAEMAGVSKSEVENHKAFLSRSSDTGTRLAYGKVERDFPRQCIFIGTTNDQSYLRDTTGNRRFWPVKVGRWKLDELARDCDQLWAEAVQAEAAGESIRLDPSLYPKAAEQQEQRRAISPIEEKLSPIFGPGGADGLIWSDKVWEMLDVHDLEKQNRLGNEVGRIMQSFGWKRSRRRHDGKPVYCYVRGDELRELFPQGSGV